MVPELGPEHPLLLLERAHDLDEDVLRRGVELAEAVHPSAHALADVRETVSELADHDVVLERRPLDHSEAGSRRDRSRLAVRDEADGDGSLGHGVAELEPGVDELVEVEVQRTEERADDRPVELLPDQREVDELDEGRLELATDLVADVCAERGQMR